MPKQYSTLITCNHCGLDLPHESYRFTKQGRLQHGRTCLPCNRKRQMARYFERKAENSLNQAPPACRSCKRMLPQSAFVEDPSRRSGYTSRCRECINAQRRQPTTANRWFKEYKKTLACTVCGEAEPCCLEFHHRDPSQKEGMISHLAASGSMARLQKELAKCIVYCSNCHKKYHAGILKVRPVGDATDWHLH